MSLHIKVSGNWKILNQSFVKIDNDWKDVKQIWIKIDNVWKEVQDNYIYDWLVGDWGDCSESCGGGTQTRPVECYREDNVLSPDSKCTTTKPNTSQSCNTQECFTCNYVLYTYYWFYSFTTGVRIYWAGNKILDALFPNPDQVTTYTSGGYVYTRAAEQQIYNGFWHTVCREPII